MLQKYYKKNQNNIYTLMNNFKVNIKFNKA